MKKLAQGAEAILYQNKKEVIKERFAKKYRVDTLDLALRGFRTRREAKVLSRLTTLNFYSPHLKEFSDVSMKITMDFIPGPKIKEVLSKSNLKALAQEMGEQVGKLHSAGIVHGDLTTSNMILSNINHKIYLFDFGLSFFSDKTEDFAVDLFLFERTLASTHYDLSQELFELVLKGYKKTYANASLVLERLESVRGRGRNKKKSM